MLAQFQTTNVRTTDKMFSVSHKTGVKQDVLESDVTQRGQYLNLWWSLSMNNFQGTIMVGLKLVWSGGFESVWHDAFLWWSWRILPWRILFVVESICFFSHSQQSVSGERLPVSVESIQTAMVFKMYGNHKIEFYTFNWPKIICVLTPVELIRLCGCVISYYRHIQKTSQTFLSQKASVLKWGQ